MATADTKSPERINYLGFLIRQHCRMSGKDLSAVAVAIGRHPSCLTRLCQGRKVNISHAQLQKLVGAVTDDPQERVGLVVAFLLDQCPPGYRESITIESRDLAAGAVASA